MSRGILDEFKYDDEDEIDEDIDIEEMIEVCDEILEDSEKSDEAGITNWEIDFLQSVSAQFRIRNTLTPKQTVKLQSIYKKVIKV